jgi:cell wall-associated NlpC family hydrolase
MASLGDKIGKQDLKPGDLVFFNTMRRTFSHVGIYLGDGKFVHAPSSGGKVRVENIAATAYWAKRFNGARRLVDEESLGLSAQVMRTR